jgi:simple sugar transport system substrate-binding protein
MSRLRITGIAALAVLIVAVAACGNEKANGGGTTASSPSATARPEGRKIRIEFAMVGVPGEKFFNVVRNGAVQAGKDLGIDVQYNETKRTDFQEQARLIRAVIAKKPDALVVGDYEAATTNGPIKEAVDAGIPVIITNTGRDEVEKVGALGFVGGFDEVGSGEIAGRRLKEEGATKVVCLNSDVGSLLHDQRCQGLAKGVGAKVQVVGGDLEDRTKTRNAVKALLQRAPDVDGIFATSSDGGEELAAAVKASGKAGKIKLATFDLTPAILDSIKEGTMAFAIDQQQWLQGYLPVMELTHLLRYKLRPAGITYTGPGLVTKENAGDVVELSKRDIR